MNLTNLKWEAEFVEKYLDDLDTLWNSFFKDLCFVNAEKGRPLSITLDNKPVRFIKIDLKGEGILHLAAVRLLRDKGELPDSIVEVAELSLSSTHEKVNTSVKKLLRGGNLFSFHTLKENNPHMILDLKQALGITQLSVDNRDDAWAHRAWNIAVEVSKDGADWERVYCAEERQQQFLQLVTGRFSAGKPDLLPMTQWLAKLYLAVKLQKRPTIRELFLDQDQAEFPPDVKALLNNRLLLPLELEFTSHGVFKSFRFWLPEQKVNYLKFANEIVQLIEGYCENVCLGYGSALAAVRDRGFIDHDDDLDLLVALPLSKFGSFKKCMNNLKDYIRSQGHEVLDEKYPSHFKMLSPVGASMDIFVGVIEGEYVSWLPGPRNEILYDEVFPSLTIDLYGEPSKIPRNPFAYLAKVYGPEWHIPDSNWHHSWSVGDYRDLL